MSASIETLLANAPYLAELSASHAGWFLPACADPHRALENVLSDVDAAGRVATEEGDLSRDLRLAKGRIALLAAWAEVTGRWTTAQSTAALSDLADGALNAALNFYVRKAVEKGDLAAGTMAATILVRR